MRFVSSSASGRDSSVRKKYGEIMKLGLKLLSSYSSSKSGAANFLKFLRTVSVWRSMLRRTKARRRSLEAKYLKTSLLPFRPVSVWRPCSSSKRLNDGLKSELPSFVFRTNHSKDG